MSESARYERLKRELAAAELKLDQHNRSLEPGMMRAQQSVAGQRAKVFTLRYEIRTVDMAKASTPDDRTEIRHELASLRNGIKEAELSARAASKQAFEDELPELMRCLDEANELETGFAKLH